MAKSLSIQTTEKKMKPRGQREHGSGEGGARPLKGAGTSFPSLRWKKRKTPISECQQSEGANHFNRTGGWKKNTTKKGHRLLGKKFSSGA